MSRFLDIRTVDIIAPNFKKRLSGVTSTIVQLVPVQARRGERIATLGPGLPETLPAIRFRDLLHLRRPPEGGAVRIWHARRNLEMLPGILLRDVLRMPLKLLFTSAAQRRHSRWTKGLIRRMDAVVATSAKSGSFLDVPHTVIRHGVDLDLFHPPATGGRELAPDDLAGRRLVGCFGRVRAQKGTDLFVAAMIALLPHHPEWTAVICGRVTPEHETFAAGLKTSIAEAGLSDRVRFLGEVDDIKPWYRRVSLLVAPSRNEGFGLTPLEAMASGAAVVASDAGAYAEMIRPGETGAVVPAGDGDALTTALRLYLQAPARATAHGQAGLAHVRAEFGIEREARALSGVYGGLLRHEAPKA
ncbi:glycosyl transferase family 1 [Rhizobium sp. Leaf371]|uniref:glycosyltransferase family 4 protein n=1 Tax=Rhizobium sp. Leaf371 TaxID=1736355 RepID=UPI0007124783|nr:glycosyltransferase family 4 protein [Rhizobium sp. Leaf371]KQS72551.1 glycosyl transferase family 1 [Rhizobium sp. Leaf371]